MAEIKLYKTTVKGFKIIAMCIPFVVIGLWMVSESPDGSTNYIMGWLTTCFFGLGIPLGLFQLLDKRPQIIITENGIWDRTTKQDEVKWEQILDAYPFDIYEQQFIGIVTDDTFVPNNKPYKWAAWFTEMTGAQKFNLHLGQIKIDPVEFTTLINQLSRAGIGERRTIINKYKPEETHISTSDIVRWMMYVLISVALLLITLSSKTAFLIIIVILGISAILARWRPDNAKLRKYSGMITWFGFINLVLCFITIKLYDKITESAATRISTEIEEFHQLKNEWPAEIKTITARLDFNFAERNFADGIEYKIEDNSYHLEALMLFGKRKMFNKYSGEWESIPDME